MQHFADHFAHQLAPSMLKLLGLFPAVAAEPVDLPTRPAVLGWVNHARRAIGLPVLDEIPKGRPSDVNRCPLARAVPGLEVHPTHCEISPSSPHARWLAGAWGAELRDGRFFALPPALQAFVQGFDAGLYPELIER